MKTPTSSRQLTVHIRAFPDNAATGEVPQALEQIKYQQADPNPLTKCGQRPARAASVNPGDETALAVDVTCASCLYVQAHPLLRNSVNELASAQARPDIKHVFAPGASQALCGATTDFKAADATADPFNTCVECQRRSAAPSA